MPVSINISAHHLLLPGFLDDLRMALARYPQVAAENLELEVLESAAIDDMDRAIDVLKQCHGMGVQLALDDFGTGYSSLTYLRKLPVDTLKIDQSFVRDMLKDAEDLDIVEGVIRLAAAFNRKIIAEGVETLAHGSALLRLGCQVAQGYGIARPMPAGQLLQWCTQWQHEKPWQNMGLPATT
jgi:EAL domain-containing protein (putative c-di-GMP-specific phosphodiesterase class I)